MNAFNNENDIEEVMEFIHEAEKQLGKIAYGYIKDTYVSEFVRGYRREDFADYKRLRAEQKGASRAGSEEGASRGYPRGDSNRKGNRDRQAGSKEITEISFDDKKVSETINDGTTKSYSLSSWSDTEHKKPERL